MKGRVGSLNLIIVLLILVGFVGNFAGADEGNASESEEESLEVIEEVVEVEEEILEDLIEKEEIVDEVINETNEEIAPLDAPQDSELENKEFNASLDEEIVENISFEGNESLDIIENITINDSFENNTYVDFGNNSNESIDDVVYVDIEDLIDEEVEEEIKQEKIQKTLFNDGKVEIEFEAFEDEVVEIKKKELKRGDLEKVVVISSEEHFENELRVYSDLPSPTEKENIKIVWENGNEEVGGLEFYDEDGDGLIERISWVVPHLSTQYYNIEIILTESGSSGNLNITKASPGNDKNVSNPVLFEFEIDYVNLSDVECRLLIDGADPYYIYPFSNGTNSFNGNITSLNEGTHNWSAECFDGEISDSVSGRFNVVDLFEVNVDSVYLIGDNMEVKIGANGGEVGLSIISPNGDENFLGNINGTFPKHYIVDPSFVGEVGEYRLIAKSYFYSNIAENISYFSVANINVDFESSVELGENVLFDVDVDSVYSGSLNLYVGGEKIGSPGFTSGSDIYLPLYNADSEGEFEVVIEAVINGKEFRKEFGDLVVTNGEDLESPEVDLINPDWEDIVSDSDVIFRYSVSDNVNVANCSFELYNATNNGNGVYENDELIFPLSSSDELITFEDDLEKDDEVELSLSDFNEGNYVWEVTCYDSAGNNGWNFNYFQVDFNEDGLSIVQESGLNSYERENEVNDLIEGLNMFLEKLDDFGPEERKALEVLEIENDMSSYKRKLIQIDQDLKHNLKFMSEDKREIRIDEINEEIDEIKENTVLDISMKNSYEFSKNSINILIEDVLGDYFEAKGVNLKSGDFNSLARFNEELQSSLGVNVEAWELKISGLDGDRSIILVNKDLDVPGDFDKKILEIIPSDLGDVIFVSEARQVDDEIWETDESEITYYFEGNFDLGKIEKIESLLFDDEGRSESLMITGFFVGVGDNVLSGFSFFTLIGFLFMGYLGFFIFGKARLEVWKKEPNVARILDLIEDTKRLLKENNVEGARDCYVKIGEIYKVLPKNCKGYFYDEISRVRLAINKKDVLNLVREYEKAKDDFRREDAIILHERINSIYKKLPKKFQERVYRRLVKREV